MHVFLVTFGCVPQKFRNPYTQSYSVDFLKTLRNISGYGVDVGYTQDLTSTEINSNENDFKSDVAIRTRNFEMISIPRYIVNNKMPNTTVSFSQTCGNLRVVSGTPDPNSCNSCIAHLTRLSN